MNAHLRRAGASRPPGSSRSSRRLGVCLLALAAAGCNVPGARLHNLNELHEDSGRHVRSGQLVSGLEFYVLYGFAGLLGKGDSAIREGDKKKISNPLKSCLSNVTALAEVDSTDERVASAQVAMFAWLAVDDPWKLSREVAVRALGAHGRALGVQVPPPREGPAAGVEEVRSALAKLVAAVRESGSGTFSEEVWASIAPGGLDDACATIDALVLDRDGALRLLRGALALESALAKSDPRVTRLRITLGRLESICVSETLVLALKDAPPRDVGGSDPGWNSPLVRAAAVSACVEAFGDPALGEMVLQLNRERSDEVVEAVLREVAHNGLPQPAAQVPEETRPLLVNRWIDMISLHAYDNPNGSVRVAAMRALARISGEPRSLREEDWQVWNRERRAALGLPGEPPSP